MTQQGKQVRVGARERFPYNLLKLVLLVNENRYPIDPNTFFFLSGKALYQTKILTAVPALNFF
jgi:hypothetical protein